MCEVDLESLFEKAKEARNLSYSPYSKYSVGAALLCADGEIYTGCNIENSAYSPSVCAERVAFFKAVSDGKKDFFAIAVAGGKKDCETCTPCGVCRQVMMEFCDPEKFYIIYKDENIINSVKLKDFLPCGFGPKNVR